MSQIDSKYFKRVVSGDKSYLPTKITKELKSAGFKSSLYGKVTKEQAMRAVRHLQSKGLISKSKTATDILHQAEKTQTADLEAIKLAKAQKHIKANIRIDLDQEISAEERGEQPVDYDPRSVLGKSLVNQLETEQQSRDEKIQTERKKQTQPNNPKQAGKIKPPSVDLANLPDMDIG